MASKVTKKSKKKKKEAEFPNISRFITESELFKKLKKDEIRLLIQSKSTSIIAFILFLILVLAVGILISGVLFFRNLNSYRVLSAHRQELERKIGFWKGFADKYDGYKDAYFQIAVLEYQLGNLEKSRNYNDKALLLDPDFGDAKKLKELLNK